MYTLRSITSEGSENNLALGSHYSYISRTQSAEAFKRVYQQAYDSKELCDKDPNPDCIGMIQSELINFVFLWKSEQNYIMTESGKTFSNLTHR